MKKSELKTSIKEEILEILNEVTPEDVDAQKEYNAELEKTKELQDELNEEDEEPTAKQLKGDSVATIATKLQQTTKEMKSTVNKWKHQKEKKNKN